MKTYTYSEEHSNRTFCRFVAPDDFINWCTVCRKVVNHITNRFDTPVSLTIGTRAFKGSKRVVVEPPKDITDLTHTTINGNVETVVYSTVQFLQTHYPNRNTFYIRFNF